MDEFRAIITYNSNSDEWPDSRDNVFIAVLSTYIYNLLLSPNLDKDNNNEVFENMIALAALDESIGVREPRAAVTKAFITGLQAAVTTTFATSHPAANNNDNSKSSSITSEEFQSRVDFIEFMLSISLRLPEKIGPKCRQMAFEQFVQSYINPIKTQGQNSESYDNYDNDNDINASVFQGIEKVYPQVATALSIDLQKAKAYVTPLGISMFDKIIGSMLMNADIAVSMPELGEILQTQLTDFASGISLPKDQADGRILYIAAAVIQSFLETALEENRRMNMNNVDSILIKCFYVCEHPLIRLLSNSELNEKTTTLRDVKNTAIKMTSKRLGPQLFIELARLVEATRQRVLVESGGAGGSQQPMNQIAGIVIIHYYCYDGFIRYIYIYYVYISAMFIYIRFYVSAMFI